MKKDCKIRDRYIPDIWYQMRKIIITMKLSVLIFLLSLVSASASVFSQNSKLNLEYKDATVKQVLSAIEDQSEFRFAFSSEYLDLDRKVSVSIENESISEILESIFKETDIKYSIKDRVIILFKEGNGNGNVQQSHSVTGKVTDAKGAPLPGVTIVIKGTTQGTITDFNGSYSLANVPGDGTLTFSFVGMKTEEILIGGKSVIDVVLQEDAIGLEEVIAIGYGSVKKSDLTGSVGSINSEELNSTPALRLDQAIKGKIAGLQAVPTSSDPGAQTSIRIRGSNSISANNEPLFVVDGYIGGFSLNDINMDDIASIEVLKDASATAIYGSRGSNGVILITTKRGKEGGAKITYDSYISFQSPSRYIPVMDASEFAAFQNELKGSEMYPNPSSYGEGTDWAKEVYRENVPMTSHTLSISGGDNKNKYFISGNYFDQQGISINSGLKRYHFRINTDHQISDKLKVGNSLIVSRRKYKPGSFGTGIKNIIGWDPTLPVYDSNGNYTTQYQLAEISYDNPVALAKLSIDNTTTNKILGTVYGEYEIIDGLTYKLNLGANLQNGTRERYEPSTLYTQAVYQGTATINNNETLDLIVENTLNYSKDFGKHSVSALIGYTRQTIESKSSMVQGRGFVSDAFTFNNLAAAAERSDANSNLTESGLESYIFRANYGFANKYLFTASARLDGASVFAANNKWGLFPSAAIAWKAGQEDFIKNLNFFDNLKLRVSYGQLGNPGLNPGASLTKLAPGGNNYILGTDQHLISGIAANYLGNPDLKWESTNQFDLGIDASFFNNRLQVTADYYDKTTKDLLVGVPLLWLTSFESVLTNFGTVSNKGIEFSLTSININRNDFKWETNFNISTNKNEVVSIIAPEGYILNNEFTWSGASGIIQEGEPIGTFYGLEQDGIWNTQEEIDESGLSGFAVFPGGKRYKDVDGDKVISETLDRKIIGHADPDFFGGLSNRLSYKAFDLYVYFSFVVGNEIYNESGRLLEQALDNNVYRKFVDRWTPDNTTTNIPSAEGFTRPMNVSNSGFVEDGSFLRLQDIRLSYNIPVERINWLNSAQVYVAGNNLLLFDSYSGYDPEISRGTDNTKRGYDHSQDPSLKSYTIGVKLDF
ncbi:TonB-dependent receptor [Sunxiuqinia sp. A32]|uniref:TonB-dependent receptor n=1 Tax=Sunxiuqinia sp. A32 TaxID=3461496 RepID=UPI00404583AF